MRHDDAGHFKLLKYEGCPESARPRHVKNSGPDGEVLSGPPSNPWIKQSATFKPPDFYQWSFISQISERGRRTRETWGAGDRPGCPSASAYGANELLLLRRLVGARLWAVRRGHTAPTPGEAWGATDIMAV